MSVFAVVSSCAVLCNSAVALNLTWVNESSDLLTSVGGYPIVEYKNAGSVNNEWSVTGFSWGGNGTAQLWLMDPQSSSATTTFSVSSSAMAFMVVGDHNDGFAQFLVDGTLVAEQDMFFLGFKSLIVSGLNDQIHTLQVIQTGRQSPVSLGNHVALLGGAALGTASVPEPVSTGMLLALACGALALGKRRLV